MGLNSSATNRRYRDSGSEAYFFAERAQRATAQRVIKPSDYATPWKQTANVTGAAKLRWDRWDGHSRSQNPLSRPLDVFLATILIIGFLPIFCLVAAAVWLDDPGPVLFRHRRVGHKGRNFSCYKFRSMYVGAESRLKQILAGDPELRCLWERDHKLPNDPRITRLGKILRLTSLDELPQLFNVLRGDMSLVGPRPIVRAEVIRYGQYINHYYALRPGITGLWQVAGRSSVTYRRRVAADVKYARARTLAMDLRILAATIPAVSMGRGSC
jgi:lipopolysaccharide/colanic/teichoic acid biosynthesis glycosyltransferase